MASVQAGAIRRQIERLFGTGPVAGLGDGELLERYAARRDETAFEAIVALHGPMVLATCRRMLADPADAEDAFQATFLVLIRRAGALGPGVALGPWLYGVACRVSLRARAVAARRRSREGVGDVERTAVEGRPVDDSEIRDAIDGELRRLRPAYRSAVVLCDLEGRTHAEAALQLGWPIGTVKGRLSRAREILRSRLARRGLAPSAAGLAAFLAEEAGASVPSGWVAVVVEAARRAAAGEAMAGAVSASALALAEGVLTAMKTNLWKLSATSLVALLVAVAGVGAAAQKPDPGPPAPSPRPSASHETKVAGPPPESEGQEAQAKRSREGQARRAAIEAARDQKRRSDPEGWRAERTKAILHQLDEPITMSFPQDTPLEDVLRYIKSNTQSEELGLPSGIPIYVDPLAIQEVEKTLQSPISLDLEGIPLSRSLHLALRQIGLFYFVEDGLLIVTSEETGTDGYRPVPVRKPTPLMEMQQKAERGELDAAQRKDFIQMLRDLKEIDALLHDPHYGKPEDASSRKAAEIKKAQ